MINDKTEIHQLDVTTNSKFNECSSLYRFPFAIANFIPAITATSKCPIVRLMG